MTPQDNQLAYEEPVMALLNEEMLGLFGEPLYNHVRDWYDRDDPFVGEARIFDYIFPVVSLFALHPGLGEALLCDCANRLEEDVDMARDDDVLCAEDAEEYQGIIDDLEERLEDFTQAMTRMGVSR